MPGRTIAVGDVHGCSAALAALIEAIAPVRDDTIITLGDYINRGPDSKGVIDQLLTLHRRCRLIPLLGNHELMLLKSRGSRDAFLKWMAAGGQATLDSYGQPPRLESIPSAHVLFIRNCRYYHETATHFFVHGNYNPAEPLDRQDRRTMLHRSLRDNIPGPHSSGKTAIVGHTPQSSGEILDLGYLICLDTGCCRGGWLTALNVASGQVWQASQDGKLRLGR